MTYNDQLNEFRGKSPERWRNLYNELRDRTIKYIVLKGGSEDEALDTLQEALYRFCKKIKNDHSFELMVPPHQYVFGFVKLVWYEQLRKRKGFGDSLDDPDKQIVIVGEDGNEIVLKMDDEQTSRVIALLDQLGKNCREILLAYYVDGQKLKDVAEDLEISYEYAKVAKHRCMKELRDKYGDA
jgi:RNA polymerase sigma factor (sigma-70 family)